MSLGGLKRSREKRLSNLAVLAWQNHFPTLEQIMNKEVKEANHMFIIDAASVLALAALVSSISTLIWALRRKA
jgi:hypothetical protein